VLRKDKALSDSADKKLLVAQPDEVRVMLINGFRQSLGDNALDEAKLEEIAGKFEKWLRKTTRFGR